MSLPASSFRTTHGSDPILWVLAVAVAALWCAVALLARGSGASALALLALASSLALLLWLLRDRQRLLGAMHEAQNAEQLAALRAGLLDIALSADLNAALACSGTLFGAARAWLASAPPLAGATLCWSLSDEDRHDIAPWWQMPGLSDDICVTTEAGVWRAVALLHQDQQPLGVLAMVAAAPAGAAPPSSEHLRAVCAMLAPRLLCRQLEHALAEGTAQHTRERRRFLSHLSHKLRTPMTAVLGFAQILALDAQLNAEHREFVREIDSAGKALLALLNELVGAARE